VIPEIDPVIPVRDDFIAVLGPDGQTLEEVSLTPILRASPDVLPIQAVKPREKDGLVELDLLHSNSIEWMRDPKLARQNPLYALSNVVVCIRNQDAVAIIDWEQKRLVWAWGRKELSSPHDATVLPSGNLLIFDNGLRSERSRVVEVDPRRNEVVWSYEAPATERFFTHHRGAAQRLSNGNTLVTDSGRGRVFEVTSSGERVWDFWNPNLSEDGKRVVIVRARRTQSQEGPYRFTASD
jgi:outer membrane protein assembly factor BamB